MVAELRHIGVLLSHAYPKLRRLALMSAVVDADGHDAPELGDELVPGVAALIDDLVEWPHRMNPASGFFDETSPPLRGGGRPPP